MRTALGEVRNNKMSVLRASREFNVPRRTLRDNLQKIRTADDYTLPKMGRASILTAEVEEQLCKRLFRLCDVGFPLTSKTLRKSVFIYCKQNDIDNPFNPKTASAGRKWFRLFMKRHPNIAQRKAQHLNEARAAKLNRHVVNDYFTKLNSEYFCYQFFDFFFGIFQFFKTFLFFTAALDEMNLKNKPQSVYNMDEKGVRMCLHKSPTVLSGKGVRRVHSRGKEHGESVTVVGCGNAVGNSIPPFVIFKGVRRTDSWKDTMPAGSIFEMSVKGSMTSVLFCKWLAHFNKFKSPGMSYLSFTC